MTERSGELVCVGTGMTMAAHLTPLARSYIERADVVFSLMSHGVVDKWLEQLNPSVRSLQTFYRDGMDRRRSYRHMIDAMLTEVRCGHKVVGAFYGHAGVFACVPRQAIARARQEGYPAHMEPGISAEDCLIADLGIDPGEFGCQQYEATQFMTHRRRIDPSAVLILWQVGVAGDLSGARFATDPRWLELLVELLGETHPPDHEVILYEATTLPIGEPRAQRLPLRALPAARIHLHTTLVIPPSERLVRNDEVIRRLRRMESDGRPTGAVPQQRPPATTTGDPA